MNHGGRCATDTKVTEIIKSSACSSCSTARRRGSIVPAAFAGFFAALLLPLALSAADGAVTFIPYTHAVPIFASLREDLWPAEFRGRAVGEIEAAWPAWVAEHDAAIRARVAAGEEDSIVYL